MKILLRIILILFLMIMLVMQFVWIINAYHYDRYEVSSQTTDLLEQALMEETFIRMQMLPLGTEIQGRNEEDKDRNIPEFVYMQEELDKLGMPISLDSVKSIYSRLLENKRYSGRCKISIYKGDELMEKLGDTLSLFNIETNIIPLRKDSSIVMQAHVINPMNQYFQRTGNYLKTSTFFILIVFIILFNQISVLRKLRKIFKIREDFSYAMIHDMKTPLSTIFMALNFLRSGRLDDKPEMKDKYYQIAEEEVDHLLTLTNKVLTIAKLEKHKLEINKEEVPLAPMIEKLTEKFAANQSKPVHFSVNLKVPVVYADKEYLEEVISNLIDNSIKYSKDAVEIQISSGRNESYDIIKVHDNGLGISKKDQLIIFQKYERASAATKRNKKGGAAGFGLGLNFVDQVITAHEGKVIVNSIEGEFTEFIIYLPKQKQKL